MKRKLTTQSVLTTEQKKRIYHKAVVESISKNISLEKAQVSLFGRVLIKEV